MHNRHTSIHTHACTYIKAHTDTSAYALTHKSKIEKSFTDFSDITVLIG